MRAQLISGALVIMRDGVELIPRAAAEKIYERDASLVLLDHGKRNTATPIASSDGDDFYDQDKFKIPNDLMW